MKTLINLLIVIIINLPTFSQYAPVENNVLHLSQGYINTNFNAKGNSGIVNSVSNLGTINPASIQQFNNFGIGLSYQFESEIDEAYYAHIGHKRISNAIPQSIGIVLPLDNFRIGLSFNQRYNSSPQFGKLPITTFENPDGTGKYLEPIFETTVNSYSALASYSLHNIFSEGSSLSFGFRITGNYLEYSESLLGYSLDAKIDNINWAFGILYKYNLGENKSISAGINYESKTEMRDQIGSQSKKLATRDSNYTSLGSAIVAVFPAKLGLDFEEDIFSDIKFYSTIGYTFWSDIHPSLINQLEFTASCLYSLNEMLNLSLGVFLTDRNYDFDDLGVNDNLGATFIIAGINYRYSFIDFGITLADSHLFSGEWRKQTMVKGEMGVFF